MIMQPQTTPYLSIVIPVFNEEDNITPLIERLDKEIKSMNISYEVILVDDGSEDGTWSQITQFASKKRYIKGLKFSRNFGHQHALIAGLRKATGQAVISMDGDLQHPPSVIKDMISKYRDGFMVVNTIRNDARVSPPLKRMTSFLFYKTFSYLTNVPISPGSSDFRLLDKKVLQQLLQLNDVELFLRGAVVWLGYPSAVVHYNAPERHAGVTKFTYAKMLDFAKGSIISFSTKPLLLGIWLGLLTSALAFLEILYVLYQFFNDQTVPGWASTVAVTSFLFGVLFIMLGIIGTYLARIHVALQNRPRYIIIESLNEENHDNTEQCNMD